MGLDDPTDGDSRPTRTAGPEVPATTEVPLGDEPTATLSRRDRAETENCLLFGLLALATGLIAPETLTRALGAWARAPGRPLREVLVKRGHLDEAGASMVAALASKHLGQHQGAAREGLIALGQAVRFRLDPGEVADSELRGILAGFVEGPAAPRPDGFGPRFELIRPHARGGLGIVSLAHDREIHREVAVKEIRDDCADHPDYRARFLREAEVTGRLEHPGIVPVYGLGYHDDGRPYYVMRFIRGETLKAAIARLHKAGGDAEEAGPGERPDLHALVGRFIDACHAVAYAHHRKILHRDLKPINIMLGPFGETLVVDWGLAKSFDGSRSGEYPIPVEEATLRPQSGSGMTPTRYGAEVGTVGYMSPEQAAGRLTELGPPSDIYSLGVTLHFLATGRPPFEGAGQEEFLRKVREGDFPSPREVNPSVPPALEAIGLKCMALRPADRYQAVPELIDDLERWRAGHPVLAYPEPPVDRLARWARGHKTALAGVAVLLACATIGLAGYAAQQRHAKRMVDAEKLAAQGDLRLTRGSLGLILERLDGPELAYLPDSAPVRLKLAGEVLGLHRELLGKHPDDPDVRFELARARRITANIGRSMGDLGQPRKDYEQAIILLEALARADPGSDRYPIELARAHQDLGEHVRLAGSPRAAEAEQLKAIDALKPLGRIAPDDDRLPRLEAASLIDLAVARLETSRPREALPQARRAAEMLAAPAGRPRASPQDRLLRIYALNARASCLLESGDRDGARGDLDEAEAAARELAGGHENTDTRFALAMVLDSQGQALAEAGDPGRALGRFDEANAILAGLYRRNQRFVFIEKELATSCNGRGEARLALHRLEPDPKRIELARSDCDQARSSLERLAKVWPGHFSHQGQLGRALANLGRIALIGGDKEAARALFEQAIARHRLALAANRESPDDARRLEAARRELEAIGPARAGAATGP